MKAFIVFAALFAIAVAFPQNPQDAQATVLVNENTNIGVGDFQSKYATSNNIQADEAGQLKEGPEGQFLAKSGSYSFLGDDGQTYTVNWVADENGYRAEGAHIPKPLI